MLLKHSYLVACVAEAQPQLSYNCVGRLCTPSVSATAAAVVPVFRLKFANRLCGPVVLGLATVQLLAWLVCMQTTFAFQKALQAVVDASRV